MVVRRRRRAAPGRCVHRSAPGRQARHPGGGAPHPLAGPGGGLRGLGLGAWSGRLAVGAAPCMADPFPRDHDYGPPAATLNLPAGCGVKPTVARLACPGADRGPGRARQVRASHPPMPGANPVISASSPLHRWHATFRSRGGPDHPLPGPSRASPRPIEMAVQNQVHWGRRNCARRAGRAGRTNAARSAARPAAATQLCMTCRPHPPAVVPRA
jgi:hypothetical protein